MCTAFMATLCAVSSLHAHMHLHTRKRRKLKIEQMTNQMRCEIPENKD